MGLALINVSIFSFFNGAYTISWEETDTKIMKIDKIVEKIEQEKNGVLEIKEIYSGSVNYQYTVNNKKYTGSKITYKGGEEGAILNSFLREHIQGDIIRIKYNPNNPIESMVYGYSLKEFWWMFIGLISIWVFIITVKMAQNDYDDFDIIKNKKDMIKIIIISEIIMLIIIGKALYK